MKLTVIGGAGVRAPRLIPSLVKRAARLGLSEVCLMDIDGEKLALVGGICQTLAERQNAPFRLTLTTDARSAISGAAHIITTLRPAFEMGRVLDERIALQMGVLGQETTGAGGFAMAMRSLPVILDYCRMADELAPGAYIYNFTNPAGLVAQGLHDAGVRRVMGICDSANGAQHAASTHLGVPLARVRHEVFGLNHLSWTRSVRIDPEPDGSGGEEVLPALLQDARFIASTHMALFHPAVLQAQGMFLNEYLHYFFHRDEALAALLAKTESRGEQVLRLTTAMLTRLRELRGDPQASLDAYHQVMRERESTYMAHAREGQARPDLRPDDGAESNLADEGYAGVALGCVEAIATGQPHYTGLNVPNQGAIEGFREDDVVEIGCVVDANGVRPVPVGAVPEGPYLLMRTIKRYERLAVQAILQRSKSLAVEALATHPLIGSYPLAVRLVDAYVEAHRASVGEWH